MLHNAKVEEKRRLKKLYSETKHCYGPGAFIDDSRKAPRLVKISISDFGSSVKFYKKLSRRATRRQIKSDLVSSKKGLHKRSFDFWYTMF